MTPYTALARWIEEVTPGLLNLMTAAANATEDLSIGVPAMRASADQIRATVAEGQRCLTANRGPDDVLSARLDSLHERFGFLARSFEADPEEFGEGYVPALAHQLRVAVADLTAYIAELERLMRTT
jgi:hypothetical protein